MRWSKYYIPTLKEAPSDAEVVSHKLMVRAGMIRKLTSGIYNWLPLGLRSLEKAKAIVRRCMDESGALEMHLPTVQPADLWKESGRWTRYGKELLRFTDRHDREYCLGPTHEEVTTDLLRGEVRSYRQLPLNLYQIQTKFRDEIRPRFGLMRGREFLMKDAYSFDVDDAHADISYGIMRQAYIDIFKALGLDFRIVDADSGAIGGSFSHEFMVLAATGEDAIASCTAWPTCTWAANVEKAAVADPGQTHYPVCAELELVSTPDRHTVQEVCSFMGIAPESLVKTLLLKADDQAVAVLLRGDHELNEIKLKNLVNAENLEFAGQDEVMAWSGAPAGFAGPVRLGQVERIYADFELKRGTDWICGANQADAHYRHLDLGRDVDKPLVWADLRNVVDGDACPICGKPLEIKRGIEVGHIFKLGVKYSEAMNANFLDENGVEKPMIMGCYGIGVSRIIAASIEQNFDDNGIIFPPPLAPFDVQIINLDPRNDKVTAKAEAIDAFFVSMGRDTLYDDREERPGVKFKDADLVGLPLQVTVGGKGLDRGVIEVKNRKNGNKAELSAEDFQDELWAYYRSILLSWGL